MTIANKNEEIFYCINCGKPVEEPEAGYCDECFEKGEL